MATIGTVNVKITGDITGLVSQLNAAGLKVQGFEKQVQRVGGVGGGPALTSQARGFSNLARAFTNAAGQSGVLNSEISILASSVGNVGLKAAGAGIGVGVLVGGLAYATKSAIGFESAITRVAKTANLSKAETSAFGAEILNISRRLPVATSELTGIAEVAGQLGITGASNLAVFTEEIAKLSTTTGLAGRDLASGIGLLVQVFNLPISSVRNLSAEITDLGNTMNSTEQQILDVSSRVAGVGAALDIPIEAILAISSLAASVTGDVEATGSAIQRTFLAIHEASSFGGDAEQLKVFADVAGATTKEFTELSKTRPELAFARFVEGLKEVENIEQVLDAVGLADVRITKTLLALAASQTTVTSAIKDGTAAAQAATATDVELARQTETTAAQFQLLKNNINATAIEIGNTFNPAVRVSIIVLNELLSGAARQGQDLRDSIVSISDKIGELDDAVLAAVGGVGDLYASIANMENTKENLAPVIAAFHEMTGAIDGATSAVGDLIGRINSIPGVDVGGIIRGGLVGVASLVPGGGIAANASLPGGGNGKDQQGAPVDTSRDIGDLLNFDRNQRIQNFEDVAKRVVSTPDKGGGGAAGLTVLSAISDGIISLTEALTLGLSDAEVVALELAAAEGKVADEQYRARIGLQAIAKAYPGLNSEQIKFRLGLAAIAEHLRKTGETVQKFILDTSTAALEGFRSAFDAIFNRPTKETIGLQLQRDELQRKKLLLERGGAADDDPRIKAFEAKIAAIQRELEIRRVDVDIAKARGALADQTTPNDQDVATQAALLTTAIGITSAEVEKYTGIVYLQEAATINLTIAANNAAAALNGIGGTEYNPQQKAFINVVALNKGETPPFPGYAQGTPYVPRTGLAMLHKGEAVIPAPLNRGESGAPINMQTYITADSEASEAAMRRLAKMVVEEQASRLRLAGFAGGSVNSHAFTPGGLR